MCSVFCYYEQKGLRCRKLLASSIYVLPAISSLVCPCFYINNCLRKFTNGVRQKQLVLPTLKTNREPWIQTTLFIIELSQSL
jgi:hypothetical protein